MTYAKDECPPRGGFGLLSCLLVGLLLCLLVVSGNAAGRRGHGETQGETYRQKVRAFYTPAEFARATGGKVRIERTLDPAAVAALQSRFVVLPSIRFTVIVAAPAATWIGTADGAIRLSADGRGVEYFAGRRWLPDDRVTGIGLDGDAAWIETAEGFARISGEPTTLERKAGVILERLRARHVRWGLTADSRLRTPGDVATSQLISTDNDGLWTAMYVAAESFRYKVTGDPAARANAKQGMTALVRLEEISGIPGFPARSFIKVGEDIQPADGEWHDTPDKVWRWKADTSSDEIVGHYFVYPIYFDLVADDAEKAALAEVLDRITTHILDHHYQLVGFGGRRTRWGFWGPDAIWDDADETGIRALHILSHLRVAAHMTTSAERRARYDAAYDDLVATHKYALLTRNQKVMVPGHVNHSDDELAFLSFYPLLRYETRPELKEIYKESLERSWQIERPERNPLWNVIYAAGTGAAEFDRAAAVRTLREMPVDGISWTVVNSGRRDVPVDPLSDRFGRRQALVVLPYDELSMSKWNGNPYTLDEGDGGQTEDDGACFLLPYWMGRYHRLLSP